MKTKDIAIIIAAIILTVCAVAATSLYFVKSFKPAQEAASLPVTNQPVAPQQAAAQPTPPAESDTMAQIVSVKPHMVTTKTPYTKCYQRTRVVQIAPSNDTPIAGSLIGGAAGGLLGNQIGGGRGRTIATVVGAVGGAITGGAVEQSMRQPQTQRVVDNVCEPRTKTVTKQQGYEVTYIYKGIQGIRIFPTLPVSNQIPIAILQATPSSEDAAQ